MSTVHKAVMPFVEFEIMDFNILFFLSKIVLHFNIENNKNNVANNTFDLLISPIILILAYPNIRQTQTRNLH